MRQIHIYNVGGNPYTSAAEAVPAILSKKPYRIIAHDVVGCVTCAVDEAIERTVRSLRYSLAKNIHASLLSAAVLILMAWPLIYNAIPMPEIVVAARVASSACTLVGLIASLAAGLRAHRLSRHTDYKLATIVYRHDGLLPPVTAWGKDRRRATFPWLGLGLVIFSIALNCVVVADYTHPAILNDGTVRRSVGFVAPWATWQNSTRYYEDNFYVAYFYDEQADTFYVLRVAYRVENTDLATLPSVGWKRWLISSSSRMINHAVENIPDALPPDATEEDMGFALAELFEYNDYKIGFIDMLRTKWVERYGPDLKLASIDYRLLTVTRAEAVKDHERHKD